MSLTMQHALIIGASGGIGAAVARALDERGVVVDRLSRSVDGFDVTDEASVRAGLGARSGPYDLIFIATGGLQVEDAPPERTVKAVSAQAMLDQMALNAVGPALVLAHGTRLLPRKGRAVVAALSARVGSIGDNRLGGWISYRAAKAALNQVLHTTSIELARTHPQTICVALHPGTVKTPLTEAYLSRHPAVTPEVAAHNLLQVMEGLTPSDSGGFFDWSGAPVPW